MNTNKKISKILIGIVVTLISFVSLAQGQSLDFPAMPTTAQPGEYVLAADKDAAAITPNQTVIFYTHTMVAPGAAESKIKDPFTERTLPNALIIPIPKGQTAQVGDVVLTWWQSGSGMQRGYVVNAKNPQEPIVKYLDLDYDNPAKNKDGVTIGKMDEQLKPESFVKLTADFAPGTAIAVQDEKSPRYTHYRVVNVVGDKIVALGFAGKMAIVAKASALPVPILLKAKAGDKVYAVSMSSFSEVTIKKIDAKIGRIFTDQDEAIAFGNIMNPIQMAQEFLTRLGYDPGPVDGSMGKKTEAAIREFQKKAGLPEDGKVSLDVAAQMYAQIAPAVTPSETTKAAQPAPAAQPAKPAPAAAKPPSSAAGLSAQEIAQMMTSKGYHSASAKGTFTHQYQVKTSGDVQVVLDQATGLMWQQSASADLIRGPAVQEYIQQINAQKHAGFADWRLPTIEELAALLPAEMNSEGVYIDAEFSGVLWNCLSASPVKGEADKFWGLDVNAGAVSDFYLDDDFSILLVRTP